MLSKEIAKIVRVTGGKTGQRSKKQYLKPYLSDPDMREVLRFALSPFISFGVEPEVLYKIQEDEDNSPAFSPSVFTDETWELFEKLANRELSDLKSVEEIKEEYRSLDPESGDLFMAILRKDLGLGLKPKNINELWGKTIVPEYKIPSPVSSLSVNAPEFPCLVETSRSEERLIAEVHLTETGPKITLKNLDGALVSVGAELYAPLETLSKMVFENTDICSNSPINSILIDGYLKFRANADLSYDDLSLEVLWIQPYDDFVENKVCPETYHKHQSIIRQKVFGGKPMIALDAHNITRTTIKMVDTCIVSSMNEAQAVYCNARSNDSHNIVLKPLKGSYTYEPNKSDWLSIERDVLQEFTIIDVEEGEGSQENELGCIVVSDNKTTHRILAGIDSNLRKAIWDDPDAFVDEEVMISFYQCPETEALSHPVFECMAKDKEAFLAAKK